MRDNRIRLIAEIGLAVALSIAINALFTLLLPIRLPMGGSLSLIMLPIIVLALIRGPVVGVTTGVLVGLSDLMFGATIISIPQMLLDYPIAYGLVGLAGIFALRPSTNFLGEEVQPTLRKMIVFAVLGTLVGGAARLVAHILSGVLFFGQYAPEAQNVWVFSGLYNISFMGPNIVLVALATALVFPVVRRYVVTTQATT